MGRKGDIESKSVACRVQMEVYLNLRQKALKEKKPIGTYLRDILSDDNFGMGGETKVVYRDKIVEKIVEKNVPVKVDVNNRDLEERNDMLFSENLALKMEIKRLEEEIERLKQYDPKFKAQIQAENKRKEEEMLLKLYREQK
jgi:hypothetical protein